MHSTRLPTIMICTHWMLCRWHQR